MRTTIGMLLLAGCCLAASCAGEGEVVVPGREPTVQERLEAGPAFALTADHSYVHVTARWNKGKHWVEGDATLELRRGEAVIATTPEGDVVIDELAIELDDVVIGPEDLPPIGLRLTDLRVRLDDQAWCDHVAWTPERDSCYAEAPATLVLEWALVAPSGAVYPLQPQKLDGFTLYTNAYADERGVLRVDVMGVATGAAWSWAGIVELTDVMFVTHGYAIDVQLPRLTPIDELAPRRPVVPAQVPIETFAPPPGRVM